MQFVNLTPHDIVLYSNNTTTTFPKSGTVARLEEYDEHCGEVGGIALTRKTYRTANLPEPTEGVMFIVSGMVLAASDRSDLVAPDTGTGAVRNDKGHIIGTTRFVVR